MAVLDIRCDILALFYNSIYADQICSMKVTSFFAPSSRYGNPEDLRELVDTVC